VNDMADILLEKELVCDCSAIHEEIVEDVSRQMPPLKEIQDLANLYKMFSDSTRLRILWALNCSEMCVCDLAVLLNMTKSAVSHQLKSLRLVNFVKYEKRGKSVYYSLEDDHIRDIILKGFEHTHE